MKTIPNEQNISRHENGNLYFVARRHGKLTVKSLKTKDLTEARERCTKLLDKLDASPPPTSATPEMSSASGNPQFNTAVHAPESVSQPGPSAFASDCQPPKPSLAEALEQHDRWVITLSKGTQEMLERGHNAVLRFAKSKWEKFNAVEIWKAYRKTGIERQGKELTSAANYLRWYLRKFIPWAARKGLP